MGSCAVFRVFACLAGHDYRLVLIAAVTCLISAFTTFRLYSKCREARGRRMFGCLLLTGVVAGSGVWATHFITMLGYTPGLRTGYDLSATLLSLALAIGAMTIGFGVAVRARRPSRLIAAGCIL